MKNAIIYLYYKLDKSNNYSGDAVIAIQLCGLFLLHLMPLIWIYDVLFQTHLFDAFIDNVRSDNGWVRRFILIPLTIAPAYLLIYVFLRRSKSILYDGCKEIEKLPKKDIVKLNIRYYAYLIGTFIFFVLGLISPSWIMCIKSW